MAIFTIIKSKKTADKVELTVELKEGSIEPENKFQLFETHHPITFTVKDVVRRNELTILTCAGNIPWENAFVNHKVDTENPKVAKLSAYKNG